MLDKQIGSAKCAARWREKGEQLTQIPRKNVPLMRSEGVVGNYLYQITTYGTVPT